MKEKKGIRRREEEAKNEVNEGAERMTSRFLYIQ
jgi:hypothetical protein